MDAVLDEGKLSEAWLCNINCRFFFRHLNIFFGQGEDLNQNIRVVPFCWKRFSASYGSCKKSKIDFLAHGTRQDAATSNK